MIKRFIRRLLGSPGTGAESLIRQIADRSLTEVCQQVEGRLHGMSQAEARGYVRAHATQIVMRETRIAIANSCDVQFASMADIVRQATERLIPQVLRKMYVGVQRAPRVAA